ncbi:unnamed protein product [Ectocarpus sp. CCAP 1310/34]|nr:unnamed protein product [Ectocarpus sp. CCAP 1310/34]
MAPLAAKRAVPATTARGLPGELPPAPADPGVFSHSTPTVRSAIWGTCVNMGKQLAPLMTEIDNIPACNRIVDNLLIHAKQLIEVELRSQHDTCTSRVFKGVGSRPTIATGPPEGGDGEAGARGGRGRGSGGGRNRGGRGSVAGEPQEEEVEGEGRAPVFTQWVAAAGAVMGLYPAPTNGAHVFGDSGTPLRSLSSAPRGGMEQGSLGSSNFDATHSCAPESFQQAQLNGVMCRASENHRQPLLTPPEDVAFLEDVQSPERKKHTGQTRRRTSTEGRDKRGGGQHVIQGGVQGAWGI